MSNKEKRNLTAEEKLLKQKRKEMGENAAENILGPNPIVGFTRRNILAAVGITAKKAISNPRQVATHSATFAKEVGKALLGVSDLQTDKTDRRFMDSAWKDSWFYRRFLQTYLAADKGLHNWIDATDLDKEDRDRAHFVFSLISDALAPSNSPLNPAALKRLIDAGGVSLLRGLRNIVYDMIKNRGMPSMVDKSPFKVGVNLATTRGAVVFRNDVLELIQYTPATKEVCQRPIIYVPPQINKYYLFDLSPEKSFVKYSVGQGLHVFAVSWRNPVKKQRHWKLDTYVEAMKEAIEVVSEITGSRDCNMVSGCAGGITMTVLLGHLAALNEPKVNAVTLIVTVLDTNNTENILGLFADEKTIELARQASRIKGVLDGEEMARVFAWMRPNDLVWNYWVNNYLLGNKPPAFDVLFWNCDTTRLPAEFHSDLLDIFKDNLLANPGKLVVCDTPIDLSKIKCDVYYVAGITDHITPWQPAYRSSRLLGGDTTFILGNSGHVQTILSSPANPKASYYLGKRGSKNRRKTADAWFKNADKQQGSWWAHWREWIFARSGDGVPAPDRPGNDKYRLIENAPGTYVHE